MNYQGNVANAFSVASNLAVQVAGITGEKIIMAHSLGNMVVPSAIEDYGMNVDAYFMLDAAVAIESYDSAKYNTSTVNNYMVHEDWSGYNSSTWCSTWHELFTAPDDRAKLTWKDRFPSVLNVSYNFYSTGDELFEIYPGSPGPFSGGPFHLERYAWQKQEVLKGRTALGSTDWAGWGFSGEYSQAEANAASSNALMTNSVFRQDPDEMFSSTITKQVQNDILALGIPALSGSTGRNEIDDIDNYNMNLNKPNGWHDRGTPYGSRWLHSDMKDMAYVTSVRFKNL